MRRFLVVASLVLTVFVSEPGWSGLHPLVEHGHAGEEGHGPAEARRADAAQILDHGHEHPPSTPEHRHRVEASQVARTRAVRAPALAGFAADQAPPSTRLATPLRLLASEPPQAAGTGPPLCHLLCTLLI